MRSITTTKVFFYGLSILLSLRVFSVCAQTMDELNFLEGHLTKTYYSEGSQVAAEKMTIRCDSVMEYYNRLIGFKPTVYLLILSPDDWSKYTDFPVYGMPHYNDSKTLIVAAENNAFWDSFIPSLDKLPKELANDITQAYTDQNGELSMQAFFDLLAIHELGHAFHEQGGLTMQREWMGELFANIFLHTYIASREPEMLPALTVFPKMVVTSTNRNDLKYTSLNELDSNYAIIGQQFPQNYGWYQCRWHMAAANIYDHRGEVAFQKLWEVLKNQKEALDDSAFTKLLSTSVDQSVADVPLKWDENK